MSEVSRGRPEGPDRYWPYRLRRLLNAISSIQSLRHTVSLRELEEACGVSRQTIANWLKEAEKRGYVDLHGGQPRALQLLPSGQRMLAGARNHGKKGKRKRTVAL